MDENLTTDASLDVTNVTTTMMEMTTTDVDPATSHIMYKIGQSHASFYHHSLGRFRSTFYNTVRKTNTL